MNITTHFSAIIVSTMMAIVALSLGSMEAVGASALSVKLRDTRLDKTGTNRAAKNDNSPQTPVFQALTSCGSLKAEGKGLEPSTGCPAPDFESGR